MASSCRSTAASPRLVDCTSRRVPSCRGTPRGAAPLLGRAPAHHQLVHRGGARSVAGLAATLAHEVKNPLSGIRGAAQLLEPARRRGRPAADPADLRRDRPDLRAWSTAWSSSATRGPIERGPVNIYQVLEHVRRLAESRLRPPRTASSSCYDPSLPEVEGDRDRLVQVFLNLVKNAAEAAPREGGEITLSTQYQHGLRVRVEQQPRAAGAADHGRGPRQRPGRRRRHGRPPVRAVRQHQAPRQRARPVAGGQDRRPTTAAWSRICPASRGATFRVRLPAGAARQERRPAAGESHDRADEDPAGRGRRRDPHRGQPRALARRATTCRRPASAATLWRWIADGDGDVVITDVVLPDENTPRPAAAHPQLPARTCRSS